ncbi:hypothetical protein BOW52_00715 [Solemya elarraichensis gill symbiont]|uniref:Large ribosomal RNA subunit accumulation protein YceD n=2 Tax=Solemya elarraichensis gill symbiont TaxID=1918949 RepID=A0A1T2LD00_9GAMM|nr:hypothetical protein BOW52_00715 [Solemya elarraichensis gill symbiont]
MSPQCPELVDPERFASQESSCSGSVRLDRFERLAPLLAKQDGAVDFRFRFSRDTRHRPLLEGRVEGVLLLQCQRCMEPVDLSVDARVSLVVVQGFDEAENLEPEFDPLIPEEERVNLLQLVEDELLLAIPAVPRHIDCEAATTESGEELETEAVQENPFDVLAQLKKSND